MKPAQSAAQDAIQQLARLVSQQPDLQFPISKDKAQTWLINTYLDEVSLYHLSAHAALASIVASGIGEVAVTWTRVLVHATLTRVHLVVV